MLRRLSEPNLWVRLIGVWTMAATLTQARKVIPCDATINYRCGTWTV
jgi:hypothetical protein